MDWKKIINPGDEVPLERYITDGGFCGIFRRICCIGDSLASGEAESRDEQGVRGCHDYFEYSWGQYIARNIGAEAYNFSRGGMTAKEYCEDFAERNNFWSPRYACQAYIIALGYNDITQNGTELGSREDIDIGDWRKNKKTFAGYYAQIIQRIKEIEPRAKIFVMTIPRSEDKKRAAAEDVHRKILLDTAELFENVYVLDFRKYAPVYDSEFKKSFFLGGHMNAAGYMLTAHMTESYIDYIIRHNMRDFSQTAFIGTPFWNLSEER